MGDFSVEMHSLSSKAMGQRQGEERRGRKSIFIWAGIHCRKLHHVLVFTVQESCQEIKGASEQKATVIAPKIGNITFDSETSSQVSY